ncbi:MAG TPA: ATP-binding cassette domain-containing protein [Desulfatiglandales bacterium]|nr:ATP-binding cassette domain-containing protein [Desulfatiglandales bacterium]
MIQIEDLHKSLSGKKVLEGVNLNVNKGEILVLIGMSGYGKSVLLKHIARIFRPDRGRVLIDGKDIGLLNSRELAEVRSRLGFLFQGGALFESMSVYDNVAFPLKEKLGLKKDEINERVLRELDQVGLSGAEDKYPTQISGGMQKRAALARVLVWQPEIILFDEPTTGLDPIIGHAILQLIEELHKNRNFTSIIVTHELHRVFKIANRAAMLHEGIIKTLGTPDEILASDDPVVRQFITGDTEGPISYR